MKSVADDTKQNKVNYKAQRNQPVPYLVFYSSHNRNPWIKEKKKQIL